MLILTKKIVLKRLKSGFLEKAFLKKRRWHDIFLEREQLLIRYCYDTITLS
jgi:hypothetical protein